MTPEDIDRMHADAVKRGMDPKKLNKLREAALKEVGSMEEAARWMTFNENFAEFLRDLRGEIPRR
ncbi:hypothetical protein [Streptosporangium sp. NBC_01756]|uniref:hypothetical protein n=1 Tax=Streptosporangium sp. NBC_01756 TaxID=2975950 RepID=UPI002DDB6AAD|nr:hypothetical protein [Streptosporangium sp. NBC_01756]WSC90073.1 hypothetical protein OIE48_18400 [Streptosporangium sp. NBC_01756]